VSRVHIAGITQREEHVANRTNERVVIPAGQVRPAHRSRKQGVANEQVAAVLARAADLQADAPGRVAGRVVHAHLVPAERDLLIAVETIDGRKRLDGQAKEPALIDRRVVQEQVVAVQVDRHTQDGVRTRHTGHVIDVRVGEQDVFHRERPAGNDPQQLVHLVTRIDDDSLARLLASQHEPVLEERRDGAYLKKHVPRAPLVPILLTTMLPITLADVYRARQRIAGLVRHTPLVESVWLSSVSRADVRLKLESLQVTNAFKARGAVNAAAALSERARRGEAAVPVLVTASAGNAGRGLAYAAERLGLQAIVFTPRDAPRTKLEAIRRHGAALHDVADDYEDSERLAKAYCTEHGEALFISPYSHPDVIAGAATIALEVFEDFPEADTFVVPVGGGGLASGIAVAAKAVSPASRIVGVEAEASQAFAVSVRAGRITEVSVKPTIADGLAGNLDPDSMTFDLVRRYVDELVQASEEDLAEGIRGLVAHEHLVAEGAGIAAAAAVLAGRIDVTGRRVAVIVSGGNIDAARLSAILGASR
jgi:threonine dehydratase